MNEPFGAPVEEYQLTRLRDALGDLDWCGFHPDFVRHTARLWGATDTEAWAIVDQLRGDQQAA